MSTVTINASCLCGTVKFTATGQDKNTVLCHCSNCKKASGSAFAHNHRLIKTDLQITQGKDSIKEYGDNATKSGNTILRSFCSNCVRELPLFPFPFATHPLNTRYPY